MESDHICSALFFVESKPYFQNSDLVQERFLQLTNNRNTCWVLLLKLLVEESFFVLLSSSIDSCIDGS
jgi:hypothetical protein